MKTTLTWAFTTWLALIALQALTSKSASGRVGQAFADVDQLLERALDPTVPAIPDRRAGATPAPAGEPFTGGTGKRTSTPEAPSPRLPVPGQPRPV